MGVGTGEAQLDGLCSGSLEDQRAYHFGSSKSIKDSIHHLPAGIETIMVGCNKLCNNNRNTILIKIFALIAIVSRQSRLCTEADKKRNFSRQLALLGRPFLLYEKVLS